MTLKQAFTEWAEIPKNKTLAARSRGAMNAVLLKEFGDMDVSKFTASYVSRLMGLSAETPAYKTKSASVLVHVLTYAASMGACVKPDFDYTIGNTDGDDTTETTKCQTKSPTTVICVQHALGSQSPALGDGDKPRPEVSWEQSQEPPLKRTVKGKNGGRPKIPVVQVDPSTGKIISRFGSMAEASLSIGSKRVAVANAIKRNHMLKGFLWFPADTSERRIRMAAAGRQALNDLKTKNKKQPTNLHKLLPQESESAAETIPVKAQTERCSGDPGTDSQDWRGTALSSFSDDQLKDELIRRGWTGILYKRLIL